MGDTNIGMYVFADDKHCITGHVGKKLTLSIEKHLKIKNVSVELFNTSFAGIYINGNSKGLILPKILRDFGGREIEDHVNVFYLNTNYSALGNLLLMNDNGAIVSSLLSRHKKEIEKFFELRCAITKIANTIIVGKAGVATNKGCLLHRDTTQKQLKLIQDVLGVSADIGTVNFGSPYVGAGVIANTNGFIAGEATSGPELGRIEEALGFLEKQQ